MRELRAGGDRTAHRTLTAILTGIRQAGRTVEEVKREMSRRERAHHEPGVSADPFVPARTLRRYLDGSGIPLDGRESTSTNVDVLSTFTVDRAEVLETYQRELFERRIPRADELSGTETLPMPRMETIGGVAFPRVWFGTIRPQGDRTYTSVDEITFTTFGQDDIAGFIRRTQPSHERHLRWRFAGTRYGVTGLFMHFVPIEGDPESRGVIVMTPVSTRPLTYSGTYRRPYSWAAGGAGLIERTYDWTLAPPQDALEHVAVLDLDGTLRLGWTVFGWVQFLSDAGVLSAPEALEDLLRLKARYANSEISHDELAGSCAQRYATLEADMPRSDLISEARVFARSSIGNDFFSFTRPILDTLKEASVAPVVISGAPAVVVQQYCELLGIDRFYGLECAGGEVVRNIGVSSEKRKICNQLVELEKTIVLAVGDSSSDRAMLSAATLRVIVGDDLEASSEWPQDHLLRVRPDDDTESIIDWMSAHLDDLANPNPSTGLGLD